MSSSTAFSSPSSGVRLVATHTASSSSSLVFFLKATTAASSQDSIIFVASCNAGCYNSPDPLQVSTVLLEEKCWFLSLMLPALQPASFHQCFGTSLLLDSDPVQIWIQNNVYYDKICTKKYNWIFFINHHICFPKPYKGRSDSSNMKFLKFSFFGVNFGLDPDPKHYFSLMFIVTQLPPPPHTYFLNLS